MWKVLFLWEWLHHATTEPIIRDDGCRRWCGGDRLAGVCVWVRYRNRRGWRNTGLNPFYFIFLGRLAPRCYSYIVYIYNIHHIIFLWVAKNIKRGFSTIQYNIISWSSFRLYKYCFTDFFLVFFFFVDSG